MVVGTVFPSMKAELVSCVAFALYLVFLCIFNDNVSVLIILISVPSKGKKWDPHLVVLRNHSWHAG